MPTPEALSSLPPSLFLDDHDVVSFVTHSLKPHDEKFKEVRMHSACVCVCFVCVGEGILIMS